MNFPAQNDKQAAFIVLDNAAEGQRVLGWRWHWNTVREAETVPSSTSRGAGSKEAGDCTNKCGIIISSLFFFFVPPPPLGKVAQF